MPKQQRRPISSLTHVCHALLLMLLSASAHAAQVTVTSAAGLPLEEAVAEVYHDTAAAAQPG